ncbi:NAD(P)-dependent dehydrogenase (short-subunit alcohol dehydrogenase family) [Nocardia transvalensis]|uniref:NAD(P)-dependent dehydrogenase (Short-subunit alcohol dehydrogenase family) n=1 Tax=Nocardia transvalensis TaxID=37333 RepID=A0A7W9UMD0_9NOCA|nr:SDR family NAD(P)-dependent oxidoreductase [Nocardia transvalensis]MBB5918483.1 NAD(P)-dependent dehydrogenase (short-subunit alcohol dehydrogenase family) [Nocardia transvalensis]
MRTVVITGGTDGMGRALAETYLRRGDRVVVLGTDAAKGQAVLDVAADVGAAGRAEFLRADLSLVAENRRVIEHITATYPVIDALVLGARYYRATRVVTAEGFESSFALFYLSRYLLGHGLAAHLERAESPVLLDLSGPGGDLTRIRWGDLQFAHDYRPDEVMGQCGKLSDLLAVAFTRRYPGSRIRYVLLHPGLTATGFTGDYDAASAEILAGMRERAQPIEAALPRLLRHLDNPPTAPLSAFMQDTPVDVHGEPFDPHAADRLAAMTAALLA